MDQDARATTEVRYQFSLGAIFLLTFVVATCVAAFLLVSRLDIDWTRRGIATSLLAASLIIVSTFRQWRACARQSQSVLGVLVHVALCVYVPFCWLLFIHYPWNEYRLGFLRMWPYLPGLFVGLWFHPSNVVFLIMPAATLLFVAGLTWLACRGRYGLLAATVLALAVEIPSGLLAYALFRA